MHEYTIAEGRTHCFGLLADILIVKVFPFAIGELQQCSDISVTPHLLCKREDQDGKVELGKPSLANPEGRFSLIATAMSSSVLFVSFFELVELIPYVYAS